MISSEGYPYFFMLALFCTAHDLKLRSIHSVNHVNLKPCCKPKIGSNAVTLVFTQSCCPSFLCSHSHVSPSLCVHTVMLPPAFVLTQSCFSSFCVHTVMLPPAFVLTQSYSHVAPR